VAAIIAAGDVARFALEIPTGWFADKYGHRASLIIGSAIQVVAMLWCWLGVGVPALVVASVLVAIGDGFRSGADQALLYRTCVALDREKAFLEIESRTHTLEVCALVGLVVAGGAVASVWGFHAAWFVETALCALGVGLACAMREPPPASRDDEDDSRSERASFLSWPLLALIVPVAFLGGAASFGSFLAQTSAVVDARELTVLVALITISEAAGAAIAPWIPAANTRGQLALAACGGALIAAGAAWPAGFHAVVIGLSFLEGLADPLRDAAIQRTAGDSVRARAASVANACDMLFSTIAVPLAGLSRY
jgi:MFS family permease